MDKYISKYTGEEIDSAVELTYDAANGNEALDSRTSRLEGEVVEVSPDGFYYTDLTGNIALKYTPENGLDAAKVSGHLMRLVNIAAVQNTGLHYIDAAGNVALKYTPDNGLDAAKVSDHFKSLIGGGSDYTDLSQTLYNI